MKLVLAILSFVMAACSVCLGVTGSGIQWLWFAQAPIWAIGGCFHLHNWKRELDMEGTHAD